MLAYGCHGRGQTQISRDNGLDVIVGLRKGRVSWDEAVKDGRIETGHVLCRSPYQAVRGNSSTRQADTKYALIY
jgi:hypothetical protein